MDDGMLKAVQPDELNNGLAFIQATDGAEAL
jgi:hypothetical protein